eukprot:7883531-Pyramimonas_sp.AAC.1
MGEARAARGGRSPRREACTLESTPEARSSGGETGRTASRASGSGPHSCSTSIGSRSLLKGGASLTLCPRSARCAASKARGRAHRSPK